MESSAQTGIERQAEIERRRREDAFQRDAKSKLHRIVELEREQLEETVRRMVRSALSELRTMSERDPAAAMTELDELEADEARPPFPPATRSSGESLDEKRATALAEARNLSGAKAPEQLPPHPLALESTEVLGEIERLAGEAHSLGMSTGEKWRSRYCALQLELELLLKELYALKETVVTYVDESLGAAP